MKALIGFNMIAIAIAFLLLFALADLDLKDKIKGLMITIVCTGLISVGAYLMSI